MKVTRSKRIWASVLSAVCALSMGITAFAAAPVSRLEITVDRIWETGAVKEPNIYTSGELAVEGVTWSQDVSAWTPGQTVQGTLTVKSTGDREFNESYGKSTCKLIGNAELVSAKRGENGKTLLVTIDYMPVIQLGAPAKAGWSDEARRKAVWSEVTGARIYQVKLYHGDDLQKTVNVGTNNYDFGPYITESSGYYFEVQAIPYTAEEREYMRQGETVVSTDAVYTDLADSGGYWYNDAGGNMYKDAGGNFLNNGWNQIDGKWYFFKADGHAVRGWFQDNGKWYYTDEDCAMKTGWVFVAGEWYYLNGSGEMQTGWINLGRDKWYYLYEDGSMAKTTKIGDYRVDSNGLWYK